MAKLLLVDDDVELVDLLAQLLTLENFHVDIAYNGKEALEKIDSSYDLLLLDMMMPILNGLETLKIVRKQYDLPILILSARGDEADRIQGLELGADDYLSKPFNDRELIARIRAILRRTNLANNATTQSQQQDESAVMQFHGLELHSVSQQAYYDGDPIELTGTEFLLLQMLIKNPGQVLSRELLSLEVLGKRLTPFDRAIDMHMSNLRKKLPLRDDDLPWFKTLRGRGYLLITDE